MSGGERRLRVQLVRGKRTASACCSCHVGAQSAPAASSNCVLRRA